eukprot:PITA_31444
MACLVAGNSPSLLGSCRSPSIRDSYIEIWTGSRWNHGFQTPRTSDVQASFVGSGLTNRNDNLPWSESGKNLVIRAVSLCVSVPEENGSIAHKCPLPPLNRKRPQRLDIPPQLPGINALFSAVEQAMEVNVEGLHYAVSSKKGRRELMEDTHKAILNVHGDPKQAFFGVFDGHSSRKASDFAANNIGQNIVDVILSLGDETKNILEEGVRAGYLETDAEFLKQDVGGVISRNGASEALTCDHLAGREDERQRIENLGGIVDLRHGVRRVQGSLAVSRAIGDWHMKQWVTAEQKTRKIEITSDCEFLILASDGLWNMVSNQEAVDIARPYCLEKQPNLTPLGGDPIAACKKLVEVVVTRKSGDDISVMIVQLRHFCKT